jgi:hypothetical protein
MYRPSAVSIYQENLDAVTRAVLTDDLALLLRHIAMPNQIVSEDVEMVVTSPDEMLLIITDFREALAKMGADAYRRDCLNAAYLPGNPRIITGQHRTTFLQGGQPLRPPTVADMMLVLMPDQAWRAIRVEARARNGEAAFISPDLAEAQCRALQRLGVKLSTLPADPPKVR